jgi:UPF0755 protein
VARGDGSHVFSADLDAHNAAVKEFQLKRRADYRSSPAPIVVPTPGVDPVPTAEKPAVEPEPTPAPESAAPQAAPAQEEAPAEPADVPHDAKDDAQKKGEQRPQ